MEKKEKVVEQVIPLTIEQVLCRIQNELKAPKNQRNSFGGYNYRSCEDIQNAVKPLLLKYDASLKLSDQIVEVGGRIYVKADAIFRFNNDEIIVTAFAREEESKKGMDSMQLTGATSSYARKYSLNGLFLIDDNKDSDATNDHSKKDIPQKKALIKLTDDQIEEAIEFNKVEIVLKNINIRYSVTNEQKEKLEKSIKK